MASLNNVFFFFFNESNIVAQHDHFDRLVTDVENLHHEYKVSYLSVIENTRVERCL